MSRVLVAGEFSGIVRDAFIAAGHDAVSCDLLPSERPGPHIQGDVLDLLYTEDGMPTAFADSLDLMIAHPPCQYLANSGVRWLYGGKGSVIDRERWDHMVQAAEFFSLLLHAPIPRIAVENPIMHRYAGIRKPDQIVQPWMFSEPTQKATCLWLKNLPLLVPTDIVEEREQRVWREGPSPDRWKNRSRTPKGLALAMASQWGDDLGGTKPNPSTQGLSAGDSR